MQHDQSIFGTIADQIESDWRSIARPEQLPPPGDWSTWLILAGRGAGKTRTGAEWVRGLAESATVARIALVAATTADARDVMVEGQSGLLSIAPSSNRPLYEPSKAKTHVAQRRSSDVVLVRRARSRLRGPQHNAAWCDELCSWRNVRETWDNLQFGLRLGKRPRQVITTTPQPIKLLKELVSASQDIDRHPRLNLRQSREPCAELHFSDRETLRRHPPRTARAQRRTARRRPRRIVDARPDRGRPANEGRPAADATRRRRDRPGDFDRRGFRRDRADRRRPRHRRSRIHSRRRERANSRRSNGRGAPSRSTTNTTPIGSSPRQTKAD